MKAGPLTCSPFLNFMRDYRRLHEGKLTEISKKGAEVWRRMNERQKLPYLRQAKYAQKMPKKKKERRKYTVKHSVMMRRSHSSSYDRKTPNSGHSWHKKSRSLDKRSKKSISKEKDRDSKAR